MIIKLLALPISSVMRTLLNPSIYYVIGYSILSLLLPSIALTAEPGAGWPTANILPGENAQARPAMNDLGSVKSSPQIPTSQGSSVTTNSSSTVSQPTITQPLSEGGQFSKMRNIGGYGSRRGGSKSKGGYRKSSSSKKKSSYKKKKKKSSCKKKRSSCSRKKSSYSKAKKKRCGKR